MGTGQIPADHGLPAGYIETVRADQQQMCRHPGGKDDVQVTGGGGGGGGAIICKGRDGCRTFSVIILKKLNELYTNIKGVWINIFSYFSG